MTSVRGVIVVTGVVVSCANSAWAEAPAINHDAVGCIVVDKFPRLEARFDPAENVSRGRLRFRPTGGAHWYSVPMRKETEAFVGVLPKPTAKLKSLDYYVEVTATDFATGRTQEYVPEVVSGLGACQGGKITAGALGSASIILEVPAGAPAVPAGFSSVGIVAAGAAATAAAGVAAAGGGGGVSTTALVLGGVAVAGAGTAAAVVLTRNTDPLATDNDGDGASENQGDCDDSNAQVRPNGGFDLLVTAWPSGQIQNCSQVVPPRLVLDAQNKSCAELTVTAINGNTTYTGPLRRLSGPQDFLSFSSNRSSRTVPSGARTTIFDAAYFYGCCFDEACNIQLSPGDIENQTDVVTVVTNLGDASFTRTFTWDFFTCPMCPAGFGSNSAKCPLLR